MIRYLWWAWLLVVVYVVIGWKVAQWQRSAWAVGETPPRLLDRPLVVGALWLPKLLWSVVVLVRLVLKGNGAGFFIRP